MNDSLIDIRHSLQNNFRYLGKKRSEANKMRPNPHPFSSHLPSAPDSQQTVCFELTTRARAAMRAATVSRSGMKEAHLSRLYNAQELVIDTGLYSVNNNIVPQIKIDNTGKAREANNVVFEVTLYLLVILIFHLKNSSY